MKYDCDPCEDLESYDDGYVDLELTTFSADGDSFKDDCCAWVDRRSFWSSDFNWQDLYDHDFCGIVTFEDSDNNIVHRPDCCAAESAESYGDCDDPSSPGGPAYEAMYDWIYDENLWVDYYVIAWNLATNNGFDGLSFIVEQDDEEFAVDSAIAEDCESLEKGLCQRHWECEYTPVSYYYNEKGKELAEYGCRHIQNWYY